MESLDNDEPIHHSEGMTILRSCPSELTSALSGESSPLITISPPVTISPPFKQPIHKLFGLLKKLPFFNSKNFQSPTIVNYYIIENPTINTQNNFSNLYDMKDLAPIYNMYKCSIVNNYYDNKEQHEEKPEAEEVPCEEVKPKRNEAPVNRQQEMTRKDYSKSPLIPFMTYPQHAQYLLEWLHLNMDNQKNLREKLKAFRSVSEKGLFRGEISYEIFNEEFGYGISQSWYSRLMSDPNIYFDDELNLSIQSLDLNIFK